MSQGIIRIRGARQHNLKNLDLDIRTGEGAASGAIARYRQLLAQLFSLLGLPNPNDGAMSMVRSDRYSLASSGSNRYGGGIYEDWSYLAW